jgi:Flp pilus assembly protein TadD
MAVLALSGCASVYNPSHESSIEYDPALLSGEPIFGEIVDSAEVPDEEIVGMNENMTSYMEGNVGERRLSVARFHRLMTALNRDGYFKSTYAAEKTNTAVETFETKSGNCLSYTNMFIALSRHAGLNTSFQVVHVPPSWDADSGYLIRYTHINVLVKGIRFDKVNGLDFTVDFNSVHPDPAYARHIVSDRYATSLFYGNRSVSHTRRGEHRMAFAYLKKAIEMVPSNPDLWINLGAFYAKQESFELAIDAYTVALQVHPRSKGAMSGLARAYEQLGDTENAELYAHQVRRYRERNPYYHFAIAQAEFEHARYELALASINTAIGLKRGNGRFYFMKGLTEKKLGDIKAANKSFRRAERLGEYKDLKLRYVNDLAKVELKTGF